MKNIFYLLLLGCTIGACKQEYATEEVAPPQKTTVKLVKAITLEESVTPTYIKASGVLMSAEEIKFSFKVGGIIKRLYFEEGQKVRKGQLLAELDMVEVDAQVLQAQNAYDKAVRDLERVERLLKDSVATLEQQQDATTGVEIAKATLNIAQFNQRYAKIVSPINGKVLKKLSENNELIAPGQPVYVLGSTGSKGAQVLKIGVADKQIVKIKPTDKANIEFSAFPQKKYPAFISEIAEEANPMTGTFDIELSLNGFFPELKNGFVGAVEILPATAEAHYRIPMNALVEGDDKQASLFVSRDGKIAQKKTVMINLIADDFFVIDTTELRSREWLIVDGAAYLSNNDSIQIIQ
ncbi:MAG: efflux RND transporter periplasmic adaptor subunit [Bacteroidota bacterium]